MKENEQNFRELKKLLKLKRHEVPPPNFFNNFSDKVVARIQAGEAAKSGTAYQRVEADSSWLARFLAMFEFKPSVIGACATGLCLLLVLGVAVTERTENATAGMVADTQDSTTSAAMSLASVTAPMLADGGGGIQISTNPVSLQPMATFFGRPNPLIQSASFGR